MKTKKETPLERLENEVAVSAGQISFLINENARCSSRLNTLEMASSQQQRKEQKQKETREGLFLLAWAIVTIISVIYNAANLIG